MPSIYHPPSAKEAFLELYQKKLEYLNISVELRRIETSFGQTNIIMTGYEQGPPLVLIHGWNTCAPIVIEDFIDLQKEFRIYAIDIPGQPNLSDEHRPNIYGEAYGQWLYELISFMNLQAINLVGISLGAFVSWNALLHDDRRISKAFFINPAGIVNANRWKRFRQFEVAAHLYDWWPRQAFLQHFYEGLYSNYDQFTWTWTQQLLQHYRIEFKLPPTISKTQAKQINRPLFIVASGKDALHPGQALLNRSRSIFPSFQEGLLLDNSKHSPNRQDFKRITQFIKRNAQ